MGLFCSKRPENRYNKPQFTYKNKSSLNMFWISLLILLVFIVFFLHREGKKRKEWQLEYRYLTRHQPHTAASDAHADAAAVLSVPETTPEMSHNVFTARRERLNEALSQALHDDEGSEPLLQVPDNEREHDTTDTPTPAPTSHTTPVQPDSTVKNDMAELKAG